MRKLKALLGGLGLWLLAVAYNYHIQGRRPVKARTVWLFWLSIALLLVVARILGAQEHIIYKDTLLVGGKPIQGVAYVDCVHDTPTIITLNRAPLASWWEELLMHERHHLKQMQTSGLTCDEYMTKFKSDPDFRLHIEAEAYCVAMKAYYPEGQWKGVMGSITNSLSTGYMLSIPSDSISTAVHNICQGVAHDST